MKTDWTGWEVVNTRKIFVKLILVVGFVITLAALVLLFSCAEAPPPKVPNAAGSYTVRTEKPPGWTQLENCAEENISAEARRQCEQRNAERMRGTRPSAPDPLQRRQY